MSLFSLQSYGTSLKGKKKAKVDYGIPFRIKGVSA